MNRSATESNLFGADIVALSEREVIACGLEMLAAHCDRVGERIAGNYVQLAADMVREAPRGDSDAVAS